MPLAIRLPRIGRNGRRRHDRGDRTLAACFKRATSRPNADRARWREGQAIVEFALASLLLMMLIFGTIDLGRAVITSAMFTNATNEGVRYGIVNGAQLKTNSTAFRQGVTDAAARRSPTLALSTANFPAANVTCRLPGGTDFSAANCSNAGFGAGGGVRICGTYTFSLAAAKLIKIGTIPMTACGQGQVQ